MKIIAEMESYSEIGKVVDMSSFGDKATLILELLQP